MSMPPDNAPGEVRKHSLPKRDAKTDGYGWYVIDYLLGETSLKTRYWVSTICLSLLSNSYSLLFLGALHLCADHLISGRSSTDVLLLMACIGATLLLIQGIGMWVSSRFSKVVAEISGCCAMHCQRMAMQCNSMQSASRASLMVPTAIEALYESLTGTLPSMLDSIIRSILTMCIMSLMDPVLGAATAIYLIGCGLVVRILMKKLAFAVSAEQEAISDVSEKLYAQSVLSQQSSAATEYLLRLARLQIASVNPIVARVAEVGFNIQTTIRTMLTAGLLASLVYNVVQMAAGHKGTVQGSGQSLASVYLLQTLANVMTEGLEGLADFVTFGTSIQTLEMITGVHFHIRHKEDSVDVNDHTEEPLLADFGDVERKSGSELSLDFVNNKLKLRNLKIKGQILPPHILRRTATEIAQDFAEIDIEGRAGQTLLIVGGQGRGKSLLCKLAAGTGPSPLSVALSLTTQWEQKENSDSRVETNTFSNVPRGAGIFVDANPLLLDGTMSENTAAQMPGCSSFAVSLAAAASGLSTSMEAFQQGMNTVVSSSLDWLPSSVLLRLSLSRALLLEPRIISIETAGCGLSDVEVTSMVAGIRQFYKQKSNQQPLVLLTWHLSDIMENKETSAEIVGQTIQHKLPTLWKTLGYFDDQNDDCQSKLCLI